MNFNIDTLRRMRKLLLSSALSLPLPSIPAEKVGPFQIPSALKVPYFDTSKEGAQDVFDFFFLLRSTFGSSQRVSQSMGKSVIANCSRV